MVVVLVIAYVNTSTQPTRTSHMSHTLTCSILSLVRIIRANDTAVWDYPLQSLPFYLEHANDLSSKVSKLILPKFNYNPVNFDLFSTVTVLDHPLQFLLFT